MNPRTENAVAVPPARSSTARGSDVPSLPLWLRIGMPAVMAAMAGILNAHTVHHRLHPTEALALCVDITPGTRLRAEHLEAVTVGGTVSREALVTTESLLQFLGEPAASAKSLDEALAKAPLFICQAFARGELLTRSCLRGRERLAMDERLIFLPVSKVRGDVSELRPGQLVYFDVVRRVSNGSVPAIEEIGPFRVAICERGRDKEELPLIYRLNSLGQPSASAELLRAAAYSDNQTMLALVEKGESVAAREAAQ